MAKKDELFMLVKSLTRSEKRYFRLYSTHDNAEANYLRLFDAMEKQDIYDERAIRLLFKGEKFVRQLHVTKHYLRELILASLRSFHHGISRDAELKGLLRNIELLFNKELYTLCETELKKAESLAVKYELYTGLVEVLAWKRRLKQALEPNNYAAFYELVNAQEAAIAVLQNSNGYWKEMIIQTWKTMGNTPAPARKPLKLKPPATLDAKVLHYNTVYISCLREGKNIEGEKQLKELVNLLEQEPHRLQEDPAPYISTINNLCSYLLFSKRDEEALELISKAKAMYEQFKITTEKKSLLKQVLRTYNLELEIYRDKTRRQKPDFAFIRETEKFVSVNKNKIPKEYILSIWFQLAHIYFMQGSFDDSLKWINNILNNKFGAIRPDLQKYARMLNILVHFEQQNFFVLRYFIDSTKRFLKKLDMLTGYDELLLKFFARLSTLPVYEHRQQYKLLYGQLFPVDGESLVPAEALDYIDYRKWLMTKLRKRPG